MRKNKVASVDDKRRLVCCINSGTTMPPGIFHSA